MSNTGMGSGSRARPLLQPSVAAQVGNQPATFRPSGGGAAYTNVFQLVRPDARPVFGRVGSVGLARWPHIDPMRKALHGLPKVTPLSPCRRSTVVMGQVRLRRPAEVSTLREVGDFLGERGPARRSRSLMPSPR